MPKIVYLVPYDLDRGIHGGILRARSIRGGLISMADSFELLVATNKNVQKRYPIPEWLKDLPFELSSDLRQMFYGYNFFEKLDFTPDIIVFEQPWLWQEAKLIKEKFPDARMVYSSQNIEWQLKERILEPFIQIDSNQAVNFILRLEEEILRSVDQVLCVSTAEADYFKSLGAKVTVIVPNGTSTKQYLLSEMESSPPYVLLVGSAHSPNIEGCDEYLDNCDLWLHKVGKIVIVGSLGLALEKRWAGKFDLGNLEFKYEVSDEDLHFLFRDAKGILLPIAYGSGTNLKTAEALVSGLPIVATNAAFRGFEHFQKDKTIVITDNPVEFKMAAIRLLLSDPIRSKNRSTDSLSWDHSVSLLKKAMEMLVNV